MSQILRFARQNTRLALYCTFWTCTVIVSVNDNFLETTNITGPSMAPALSPDYNETGRADSIAWRKRLPVHNLKRGDIVHFDHPLDPERLAVKRVIGLPGDTVLLDPRRRPSLGSGPCPEGPAWDAWRGKAVVPKGHVWVEGDNWRMSMDSNWYGPISKSLITGKAEFWVRPLSKFGTKPSREFETRTKVIRGKGDLAAVVDIERG